MDRTFTIKLRVGDTVMVRRGRDKGKTGKISAVHPDVNAVTVEGVNVMRRHRKPSQVNPTGSIEEITKPIGVHKVGIVHPDDKNKTSRIGFKTDSKGEKKRVYRQAKGKEIK